jgi:Trk-type K+ transport system membrane component
MEQTALKSLSRPEIIWFCNECLISTVQAPEDICTMCRAKRTNRMELDRDQAKRDLVVFVVVMFVLFAVGFASIEVSRLLK